MKQPAETVTAHASIPGLSDAAWRNLTDLFGDKCRYCGSTGTLERDHRVPMSRNGENRIKNIVPACALCNRAKASATEEEYLSELRRLWGRRVPRTLARLDERLKSIESKLQHDGMTEPRSVTLLRSLHVPAEMWISPPREAHMAIHRDNQHPIAGSSFQRETLLAVLGRRDEWKGNVALVPQPDNPNDPNAVAVVHSRGQIGFLPAPVAADVSRDLCMKLREGRAVAARCALFRTPRGIGGRVKLDVPLETRVP